MNIPWLLYEDRFWVFVLITIALGGGAAWLTGRAIALSWWTWWQAVLYALILGWAVRFFHYALFRGTFNSAHYYAVDALVCLTLALVSFRVTRARQMTSQYAWINERNGIFGWRRRQPEKAGTPT